MDRMELLLLNQLYSALRTAVLCLDAENRIRYCNACAATELAEPPESVIDRNFEDLFCREEVFSGGQIWRFSPSEKRFEFDGAGNPATPSIPVLSRLPFQAYLNWGVMHFTTVPEMLPAPEQIFANCALLWLEGKHLLPIAGGEFWSKLFGEENSILESLCAPPANASGTPVSLALPDAGVHRQRRRVNGRDYLIAAYPIRQPDRPDGMLTVGFDLTDIHEVQARLMQTTRNAEAANKAKNFFLANISHELRPPLNAVIGYCELLQEGGLSGKDAAASLSGINFAGNG